MTPSKVEVKASSQKSLGSWCQGGVRLSEDEDFCTAESLGLIIRLWIQVIVMVILVLLDLAFYF